MPGDARLAVNQLASIAGQGASSGAFPLLSQSSPTVFSPVCLHHPHFPTTAVFVQQADHPANLVFMPSVQKQEGREPEGVLFYVRAVELEGGTGAIKFWSSVGPKLEEAARMALTFVLLMARRYFWHVGSLHRLVT